MQCNYEKMIDSIGFIPIIWLTEMFIRTCIIITEMGTNPENIKIFLFYSIDIFINTIQEYLSPEEFKSVFNVSKEDFDKLPAWKRTNQKKDKGLFQYSNKYIHFNSITNGT